jgi:CRP-like cAMP-binding protein
MHKQLSLALAASPLIIGPQGGLAGEAATMQSKQNVMPDITDCADCPLRIKEYFRTFTQPELDFVREFKVGEFHAEPGTGIIGERTNPPHLYTVLEGWAFRYKTLADGSRQILNFALPGDFIGLQTSMFGEMDHSVDALSHITLCVFPREKIWELFKNHPELAFDATWLVAQEEKVLGAHLTSVGRRSAQSRIAFVLLHLYRRCEGLDLAGSNRMKVPFNQQHLADLLGLSLVHTNKTLKRLEASKLMSWQKGTVRFLDRDTLAEIAEFDEPTSSPRPFI